MSKIIHVTPYEPDRVSHRADRRCPCGPKAARDMLEPANVVWVHRNPPAARPVVILPDDAE